MLEVHIERRPVIEAVHLVCAAPRHEHRLPDRAQAVPHPDPEWGVGRDSRGDDRVRQNLITVYLKRARSGRTRVRTEDDYELRVFV
jgi:hypothetical protein